MRTLIKNVNIIMEDKIIYGSLIVENGIIGEINEGNIFGESFDTIVDGENKYLSSGFIDIHNHGNFGRDTMEGTFESLDTMASFHIKNGITGFLATTMTDKKEKTIKAIKNCISFIDINQENRSKLLGIHMEGPYFSTLKKGAQPGEFIKDPIISEIKEYLHVANGNIKILSIAPEIKGATEAIEYLKGEGVTVSLGHSNANYQETISAIEKGATSATHIFNGMREFNHREPGIVGGVLTEDRVSCELICDGIHLHKGAMKMVYMLKGVDKIILISDAMMAAGLEDGEYSLGGQKVIVDKKIARLEDGTLAGSTLTLNKAVFNMVNILGVNLWEAVKMASLNPAKLIKLDSIKGSIEKGKEADLIIFDNNLEIQKTFIYGKIVYSNKSL